MRYVVLPLFCSYDWSVCFHWQKCFQHLIMYNKYSSQLQCLLLYLIVGSYCMKLSCTITDESRRSNSIDRFYSLHYKQKNIVSLSLVSMYSIYSYKESYMVPTPVWLHIMFVASQLTILEHFKHLMVIMQLWTISRQLARCYQQLHQVIDSIIVIIWHQLQIF